MATRKARNCGSRSLLSDGGGGKGGGEGKKFAQRDAWRGEDSRMVSGAMVRGANAGGWGGGMGGGGCVWVLGVFVGVVWGGVSVCGG